MSALQKLVKRCDEMDITEQINIFNDAFLPANAKAELAHLQAIKQAATTTMASHDAAAQKANFLLCGCHWCAAMRPTLKEQP